MSELANKSCRSTYGAVRGWSKAGVGQTCAECRVGFYRDGETCVACGENQVCETTDVTLDNFECIAGAYRNGDECRSPSRRKSLLSPRARRLTMKSSPSSSRRS